LGEILCFVGYLGSEPRLAPSQTATISGSYVKLPRLDKGSGGRTPTFHPIPWHLLYNCGKSRKTSVRVAERRSADPNKIRLVDLAIASDGLDWPTAPCRPWLSRQATGSILGQRKYLPSCRTSGFPTSANFESKLAVRALMWSAKNGTPRSSCICLLLTYKGAPLARRRHLDCSTCTLRTREPVADLQAGHA